MSNESTPFHGQNALVTGSTRGLGEAAARLLAERGLAGMIITGRDVRRGEEVAREITLATDCHAQFIPAELADPQECQSLAAQAIKALGKIHVLVNAAGVSTRGSIDDTSVALWDALMAINLRAPFLLTQACVKHMREHQIGGSIVNVISVAAHGGQPFLTPYATSKGGLATFTKNVAYAVMRQRIRVNGIMLGWTDTPTEDRIQRAYHSDGEDWLEDAEASRPFGRLIKPEEAARAIAWLASEESGLMTGALIDFDQTVPGAGAAPSPTADEYGLL